MTISKCLFLSVLTACATSAFALDSDSNSQGKPKVYLVSTAHFDTQWNWDVRESIDDYLHRTMVQNFWLFEKFPDYVFNFESAQKYAWMKEYYPAEYEKVKAYIKSGRWNVCGSAWEANDPNLPSTESNIRNLLYGQEFYKKEFGVKSNDIYLPDCFGFGYTLPSIAAHCGLIGFSTQKLQWRKAQFYGDKYKMPFPIGIWRGIDGSQLLAVLDAGGYGTSYYYDDITTNKRIIDRAKRDPNGIAYSYYGVGDRGGSPTLPSVFSMQKSLSTDGDLEVISAKAGQLYEDFYPFENHPELPVFDGELLMDVHGVGCYTSQAAMKRFNRRNEKLGDAAERASVVAELLGGPSYPADALRENWQRFIWHQFHDDITGTSIPRSYTFSWNDELIAQTRFVDAINTAVGSIASGLDTRVTGIPVVVFNPVNSGRTDIVEANITFDKQPRGVQVIGPDGKKVPSQLLSWKDGVAKIIFSATVAPSSYTVYDVRAPSSHQIASKKLYAKDNVLENSVYRLELDKNGDIKSVLDKRNGENLVKDGDAFKLMVLTENESHDYPAWEIYISVIDGKSSGVNENVRISVCEYGPLRATLKVERDYRGSQFTQFISLTDGATDDLINVLNEVDWVGKKSLLKAEFPTSFNAQEAAYDLGLGYVMRGNNTEQSFEVLGHQWADMTSNDNKCGIAILNDSKYGWDKPNDNTLRLTLLHTPEPGRFYTYQDHQDHGHHTFNFAIVGHAGGLVSNDIPARAELYNQPLMPFVTNKHAGKLGQTFSFMESNNPAVEVLALKKAEDGNGYILRVAESQGADYENAEITFANNIVSACEVNGIEENVGPATVDGKKIIFNGKRFAPRSFRINFENQTTLTAPKSIPVDLPLNAVAFTSDEFNKAGDFDRRGNSLAYELMPDSIVDNGIIYKIQNDPSVFNYVRSNADTIFLPENHGAKHLYMLATSIQNDRKTTFNVNGIDREVNVPYYSGFYGQWGWNGESEGFLKDVPIGYVANHTHSAVKGNDSYNFAYLYRLRFEISDDTRFIVLPRDAAIAVFAITLSNDPSASTAVASELRTLPKTTKNVEYVSQPMPYYKERSLW